MTETASTTTHPDDDRVGLMITRGFEHLGHSAVKTRMLADNARNIIAFGSCNKSGVLGNPFTADQKRRAQLTVWGRVFKMVFLQDIGAVDRPTDWVDYVMDRIHTNKLPEPTDLYAGSLHEARWYSDFFAPLNCEPSYRIDGWAIYENDDKTRRIHILDREVNIKLSASQVRFLIEQRDPAWHNMVPAQMIDFYEREYPPHLRVGINLPNDRSEWPTDLPVGTKGVTQWDQVDADQVYIFRDDGKWRVRTEAEETAKSLGD